MSDELKPCPFDCGPQKMKIVYRRSDRAFYIECPFCGARGPFMDSVEEAIKAWNRRATGKE